MVKVDLFAEDHAHELFASAAVERIFREEGATFELNVRNSVGGHGRAITEFQNYQRAIERGALTLVRPDLLVIMIDANCRGLVQARKDIQASVHAGIASDIVIACPDPHIERWLFADPEVFRDVVGGEVNPGRRKCERNFYKNLLRKAVSDAGHMPSLGGLEFTAELVAGMDEHRAIDNEPSLRPLFEGIRAVATRDAHS
jgi:hypothetical protein